METFSALLALCAGNSPVPANSPHKGQWRWALMFSLICTWINDWVNNREAGDLRRHRGHYDVNVMSLMIKCITRYQWLDVKRVKLYSVQINQNVHEIFKALLIKWLSVGDAGSFTDMNRCFIAEYLLKYMRCWYLCYKVNDGGISTC